jgi:uncharacterized membrane protein
MSDHPVFQAAFALLTFLLLTTAVPPAHAHKDHETPSVVQYYGLPSMPSPDDVQSDRPATVPVSTTPTRADVPTSLFSWLGRFHPVVVHFPIALLISAAIGETLFARTRNAFFSDAVRFCIWIGVAGALVAAPLGWIFAGFRLVDDEWVLTAHRWAGTTTFIATLTLFWVSERTYRAVSRTRTALRYSLGVVACLVSLTGFLGGSLLYGIDHYAW